MTWVTYILHCADDTYYTGITNDLDARIQAHNDGVGAKYTKPRTPVHLVYSEECEDRSAASKREYAIKRLSRSEKIELIKTGNQT